MSASASTILFTWYSARYPYSVPMLVPERALSHLFWPKPSRDYTPYGVVVVALRNRSDLRSKGAACLGGGAGLGTEYYTGYAFGAAANVAI